VSGKESATDVKQDCSEFVCRHGPRAIGAKGPCLNPS
jgi:hypothetical protein